MIKRFLAVVLMLSVVYVGLFFITPQFTDGPVVNKAALTQEDIELIDATIIDLIVLMKERNGGE